MATRRVPSWLIGIGILLFIAIGIWLYRYWQGPVLPAYQVSSRTLVQNVVATGRVISTSRAQVGSEITGVVLERRVQEGDRVAPGDVLLVLRADEFQAQARQARAALAQLRQARRPQAQARVRQAEAQLAQARREVERSKALLAAEAISRETKEQADQALANAIAAAEQARLDAAALAAGQSEEAILQERLAQAEAALAKTRVRAEFAGTVLTRNVEPGDVVQPGRVLFEIARTGATEILVPVDERNLRVLALGQSAVCIPDAYPDRQFKAVLHHIAPAIDAQRGTVEIRLRVDAPPVFLRNDMTVTANIETGRADNALSVPNDALFDISAGRAAALVVRQGKVERAALELGMQGLAMTQVTAGLASGDWVLTDRSAEVGQRVRVTGQATPLARDSAATSRETPVKFN